MMKGVAHPRRSQPEWRDRLVILKPEFFIFERVHFAKFARQIPCQRIDLSAFLDVLDDDGDVSPLAQHRLQACVDRD